MVSMKVLKVNVNGRLPPVVRTSGKARQSMNPNVCAPPPPHWKYKARHVHRHSLPSCKAPARTLNVSRGFDGFQTYTRAIRMQSGVATSMWKGMHTGDNNMDAPAEAWVHMSRECVKWQILVSLELIGGVAMCDTVCVHKMGWIRVCAACLCERNQE